MKAMNLTASRRRNQVVILSGVRPGAKLSTSEAKAKRTMSADTELLVSLLALLPCAASAVYCALRNEISPSPWWVLGFVASWLPLLFLPILRKGGRR